MTWNQLPTPEKHPAADRLAGQPSRGRSAAAPAVEQAGFIPVNGDEEYFREVLENFDLDSAVCGPVVSIRYEDGGSGGRQARVL